MIKYITEKDLDSVKELHEDYYGRKILSYYYSYGTGYDFCRFYEAGEDGTKALRDTGLQNAQENKI